MKSWKDLKTDAHAAFAARAQQVDEVFSRYSAGYDQRDVTSQRKMPTQLGEMNNLRDAQDFTVLAHPSRARSTAVQHASPLALSRAADAAASTTRRDFVVRNLAEGRFYGFVLYRKLEPPTAMEGSHETFHTSHE
jgi:hypothetical protein